MMKTNLKSYRKRRESLIAEIIEKLSSDERFVAAWLTGSYGRNDADEVSDLDLNLVVAEPYSKAICARQEQVSDKTTEERLALFSRFGEPALIHENNNNAPENGTFTFVLYTDSALMIDWALVPQTNAVRPFQSLLLFDKINFPVSPLPQPEELKQSKKSVAEKWAFFWMMTAVTIKYIIREDNAFVALWLENLHRLFQDTERQINREPWKYVRGSFTQFQPTREKQIESIRELCDKMQKLKPRVAEFIGIEPSMPMNEIETLLSLANK